MDISIIIVNYNTIDLLLQCIKSIYKHTKEQTFEIIVVDNASTDNSIPILKKEFPLVYIIENSSNQGFGRANNLGIKKSRGKYIFLLNSDTILLNDSVNLFFEFAEKSNCGALGCILFDKNLLPSHSYGKFPKTNSILKNFLIKEVYSILRKKTTENVKPLDKKWKEVEYITGADLFIPAKVLQDIGIFDESFFMYYEETDLQYRMHKAGYKRYIIEGPQIMHLHGASTSKEKIIKRFYMDTTSMFIYLKKHKSNISYYWFRCIFFIINTPIIFYNNYSIKERILHLKTCLKFTHI